MEYKKIIELTTVVTGGTPSTEKREYWDNGSIPWLQSGCCQNCEVNSAGKYITQEGYDNSSTRMMPADTVMIALTGATAGKVGYLNFAACGNQSITGILPCGALNQRYLFYYLISQRHKILADCVGGAQAHISQGYVKNIKVPVLSLVEQEQVVEVLTQLNNIISMRRKEIGLLDTLVKSRFVELFGDPVINSRGWKKALIGDDCFVTKLAGFEYTQYINYEDSGDVVMVKAQNVKNGKLNRKELSFVSNEVSDSLPRSQLAPGDVVMTYVGANIGDVAIIDNEYKYHLAPNVAKIRPDSERYNSIYFMYMLMLLNAYIVKNSADTAKAALGMERIRKLNVFVPPMELQNQFADFVTSIDKSKSKIQKSLEETQLLFDSLMQKYFG